MVQMTLKVHLGQITVLRLLTGPRVTRGMRLMKALKRTQGMERAARADEQRG